MARRCADIAHVLAGPFCVITINTKHTRGKVWVAESGITVNGVKVDYLRNYRHERQRVGSPVNGFQTGGNVRVATAIVFVGTKKFTLKSGDPQDISVLFCSSISQTSLSGPRRAAMSL